MNASKKADIGQRARVRIRATAGGIFAAAVAFSYAGLAAAAENHEWGATTSVTGRIVMEDREYIGTSHRVPILHFEAPISLIYPSKYPGDARPEETTEIHLLGDLDFSEYVSCTTIATGTLHSSGRASWIILADVGMWVQRIECKETGKSASLTSDPQSWRSAFDTCAPSSRYSAIHIAGSAGQLPFGNMDEERWVAADLLMRSGVSPRWSDYSLDHLWKRLADAKTRLFATFDVTYARWDPDYYSEMLEVQFSPRVQVQFDAVAVPYNRTQGLPTPLDSGLETLCESVCGCTVVPGQKRDGVVPMSVPRTTNLFYMVRHLRELPDVKMARLVRRPPRYTDLRGKSVLHVKSLPSGFHFTVESTDLESKTTKRYFVVDDQRAQEVYPDDAEAKRAFEPLPVPGDVWR